MQRHLLLWALTFLTAIASQADTTSDQKGSLPSMLEQGVGAAVEDIDFSADPCVDFYQYACGGWLAKTELPGDEVRWLRSFSVVRQQNRETVREILESAHKKPGDDPDRQAISDFYGSCMAEKAVEKAGIDPIIPLLQAIGKIEDTSGIMSMAGQLHRAGVGAFFGFGSVPDFKDPDLNISILLQGGLGLPDRDYYLSDEENFSEIRGKYHVHMEKMFTLAGDSPEVAKKKAEHILGFETKLAEGSRSRTDMRQTDKLYHRVELKGLQEQSPQVNWEAFLKGIGFPDLTLINVATPEYFTLLNGEMTSENLSVLKDYLSWHTLSTFAPRLSSAFVKEDFAFYSQTLTGQSEMRPRWRRCVNATSAALGETIGRVYVAENFAGSSKEIATTMIEDIIKSFEIALPKLAWMDEQTAEIAMKKAKAVSSKIGYPDKWRDYSKLVLGDSYLENTLASNRFESDFDLAKVGTPVDKTEWGFPPQTVNAFYNPLNNDISFPAGILQPPFFHKDYPAAMNYGGIGGAIGHELSHGFDDQGRKFDPTGKMQEWWQPEVAELFQVQAQCVDDLYSAVEIEKGVNVNGKLTLGENIADLGGTKQAWQAYQLWNQRNPDVPQYSEKITNEQLFFISFGQLWCTIATPEEMRRLIKIDPHSPGLLRANLPMSQHPAFGEVFGCKEGTPMNPKEKCEVW